MERTPPATSRYGLYALNFFMADMQAGIGPFLGVFLLARHWGSASIGLAMTLGGIAGMIATVPAGILVDATNRKRGLIVVCSIFTVLASALLFVSQSFWMVTASQVATAIAGAALGPGVAGLTLGIVRQKGFNRQNGLNQAFNHGGNMIGAALSGYLGWRFGLVAVFGVAALFGLAAIAAVLVIPANSIDDREARGLGPREGHEDGSATALRVLLECRPLLVLAAALALFHLGNAAMLPLYGMAVVGARQGDPAAFVAKTIVVAQAVMIATSFIAMRMGAKRGYWLVLLIAFLALPVRGAIAAWLIRDWGVYPVQALDGIGAGLQSVAVPGLVARLLDGTGRVNAGQGAIMTVQGIGAALSPALGGWIAEKLGYPVAFLSLGALSLGALVLWLGFGRSLRGACA
jgi:MFS family permease